MILPVLAIMFLASFDGGRALAVYMKVRAATYALEAITNQYSTIQSTDMTNIVGATSTVMAPYSSSPAVVTISQIEISSTSNATVSWSYSQNGTARTPGNTLPMRCDNYPRAAPIPVLIFGQVSYTFTPLFGFFTSGAITLSDRLYDSAHQQLHHLFAANRDGLCRCLVGVWLRFGRSGSGSGSSWSRIRSVSLRLRVRLSFRFRQIGLRWAPSWRLDIWTGRAASELRADLRPMRVCAGQSPLSRESRRGTCSRELPSPCNDDDGR